MALLVAITWMLGCGQSDVDTDWSEYPDISGRYNMIVKGATGCAGQSELVTDWADGPLAVSGVPDDLSFDFGDNVVLAGTIAKSYSYQFGGLLKGDGLTRSISSAGVAFQEGVVWDLKGDLDVAVSNGNPKEDCTISGPYEAYQVAR